MKKTRFLVVYDYGQGGVWAYVHAHSRELIERTVPSLRIVDNVPPWMSETDRKRIERRMTFDLDRPTGWLADLIAEGGREGPSQPTATG